MTSISKPWLLASFFGWIVTSLQLSANAAGQGAASRSAKPEDGSAHKYVLFDELDQFHRISIVSDADSSMIQTLTTLKEYLHKIIDDLSPDQLFSMVFFSEKKCEKLSENLIRPLPEHLRKAHKFLEGVVTTLDPNPIPALEAAFRQKPEVMYFITDRCFPDNDAVLKKILELNKDRKVKIFTIAFVTHDDEPRRTEFLKKIADENGERFKLVKESELPMPPVNIVSPMPVVR